ncbi:hypothetical protein K493DRAFT_54104 [Basidiobolus meristosporus CBS 931.73]|uniref:Uncharacterized protein n=1 Tax=Basidiobolus meristosporus CBS 931.73 TaxID=1314790 RepID=A0A1Y1XZ95_9FUNG|nr:hypothetical protein K493DRAFT_54104 [Basidiobolus meristosporus CBS 931.73]|eukprot:ORX91061.1 hypothetical protein K493DRAFT_54104 [Basidiobolus meristosporus CBS 931.73]
MSALGLIDDKFSSVHVKQTIYEELKLAKTKADAQIKQLLKQLYQNFEGSDDEGQGIELPDVHDSKSTQSMRLDIIPENSSRQRKPPKEFSRPKSWPPTALASSHVTLLTRVESLARQILDVEVEELDQQGRAGEIMSSLQQFLDEQRALSVGNALVDDFLSSLVWIFAPCARLVGDLQKINEDRVVFDTSDLIRVETPTILEFTSPFRPTSPLRNECSQSPTPEPILSRPLFTPPVVNTIPASPVHHKAQSLPPSPTKTPQTSSATISTLSASPTLSAQTSLQNSRLQGTLTDPSRIRSPVFSESPPFLEKRRVSESAILMRPSRLMHHNTTMEAEARRSKAGSDIDQVFLNSNLERELMLRRGNSDRTPTKPKEHRKSGRQVINFFKSLRLSMSSGSSSLSTSSDTPPQTPTRTSDPSSEKNLFRPQLDREQSRKSTSSYSVQLSKESLPLDSMALDESAFSTPDTPEMILCRICEEEVSSYQLDRHSEHCAVTQQYHIKQDEINLGLQRLAGSVARRRQELMQSGGSNRMIKDAENIEHMVNKTIRINDSGKYATSKFQKYRDKLNRIIGSTPSSGVDTQIINYANRANGIIQEKSDLLSKFHTTYAANNANSVSSTNLSVRSGQEPSATGFNNGYSNNHRNSRSFSGPVPTRSLSYGKPQYRLHGYQRASRV